MTAELLSKFEQSYLKRRVLITGHTGFTGGWLASWLLSLEAEIFGISLRPLSEPNLFDTLKLDQKMSSIIGNINDADMVNKVFKEYQPEIVFHLAAQPIVSVGYSEPVETFNTNVIGTLNILEAARNCKSTKAVVCITTDKVYRENQSGKAYIETDQLGGKDPYSASKACAELVAASYIQTMADRGNGVRIATARGGNIIGGGDWSENRIVPDFMRALVSDEALRIRNPKSTRPFQHVLSLVHGYLLLGDQLLQDNKETIGAWNFGPADNNSQTVKTLVNGLSKCWREPEIIFDTGLFPEANDLNLDSSKSMRYLKWLPPLDFEKTVSWTAEWYRAYYENTHDSYSMTCKQVEAYRSMLDD